MAARINIQQQVLLHINFPDYDYSDSYEYAIRDEHDKITVRDIAEAFTEPYPQWFQALFTLRNKIVSVFGLKTGPSADYENNVTENQWDVGSQAGIFKVYDKNEAEMVLGEDDKHLDVRVGLLVKRDTGNEKVKHVVMTTVVKYNNRLGRAYFFFVKPFHRTAVPYIMKQKVKALGEKIAV